jgi:hypothetical protein
VSHFCGQSMVGSLVAGVNLPEHRLWPMGHQWRYRYSPAKPWEEGRLWPMSRMGGDCAIGPSEGFGSGAQYEEWRDQEFGGGQQMARRTGSTLDSTGAPLASCAVDLYLVAGDQWLRECQSDLAGYYEVLTQFTGQQHYVVARKTASPNLGGVSDPFSIP